MTPDSSSMDSLSTAKNWPIVWLWGKRLLMFQHELDPHQPPHQRAPRDRLLGASRCARDREVGGAERCDAGGERAGGQSA